VIQLVPLVLWDQETLRHQLVLVLQLALTPPQVQDCQVDPMVLLDLGDRVLLVLQLIQKILSHLFDLGTLLVQYLRVVH